MPAVFINVFAVILGACPGLLLRRGIPKKVADIAMLALGLCSLYIGFSGSLQGNHVLILIPSMVLGAISGTLLDIDGRINRLAGQIEKKFQKPGKELSLAEGLVSATLLFCVGSMTVTGSLQAGLTGDYSILITKSCLDLISSFMLASTLGAGVLLSAVSVLVIQGGLVLLSGLAAPLMSPEAIQEMTCAGSLMILMIGTNLLGVTKIKVADFLPGILFAPLLCLLLPFFEKLKDLFF